LPPAKKLTLGGVHLVQSPAPNAYGSNPQTAKFSKREIISMSWIHEMVDGHDLSEVLRHHQHVIDPYRFMNLSAQDNTVEFASKSNPPFAIQPWRQPGTLLFLRILLEKRDDTSNLNRFNLFSVARSPSPSTTSK
jgi:hypothetical protein